VEVTRDALRRYYPDGKVGGRLVPLPEYGCIWVRNPKVGTGTMLLWLHRVHTGDHGFHPKSSIHAEHTLPRPADVGWARVVRMLNGQAFRFAFVRDPVRRAESAYLNKVVQWRERGGRGGLRRVLRLQRALGLVEDPERELTFDQFVAALEAQSPLEMDAHWRPQHLNLMHGLIEYDLVGRLETFADDLDRIREATGMPEAPAEVWRNVSDRSVDLIDGRPDLMRRIWDLYAQDFELYGYERG
jgi:Sulfotransferase family